MKTKKILISAVAVVVLYYLYKESQKTKGSPPTPTPTPTPTPKTKPIDPFWKEVYSKALRYPSGGDIPRAKEIIAEGRMKARKVIKDAKKQYEFRDFACKNKKYYQGKLIPRGEEFGGLTIDLASFGKPNSILLLNSCISKEYDKNLINNG